MTVALIDGGLIYRCCFATQKTFYRCYIEGEVIWCKTKTEMKALEADWKASHREYNVVKVLKVEPVENCLNLIKIIINKILLKLDTGSYKIYLDPEDRSNYRYAIAKSEGPKGLGYKAGRPNRPYWYKEAREYMRTVWNAQEVSGIEADDAIAIEHCNSDSDTVICTYDKDLNTVPGKHYNFVTDEYFVVNEKEAIKFFYKQVLMGDPADNIRGLPKIGPVRAEKILKHRTQECEFYEAVEREYLKFFKGDIVKAHDYLLEQARLLWIQRRPGQMWNPPKKHQEKTL